MPIYAYECPDGHAFDRHLPLAEFETPQTCECGEPGNRVISPVGFVLKGDGWPGKNLKIRGQMTAKNNRLSKKSRERSRDAPGMRLAPNVDGERVDSWEDAQKLAASKGKDTTSYGSRVREEQST